MRLLSTVRKISKIQSIKGADNIELATVEGWKSVVPKDQYKPGDIVLFFEPDSVLPEDSKWVKEYASFMSKDKYRVRTKKFNKFGVISQGLILPINVLLDKEVSKIIGVKKHELEMSAKLGDSVGLFPYWITKTDELHVQSSINLLKQLQGKPFYITMKMDGSSCTSYIENNKLVCASRDYVKKDGNNVFYNGVRNSGADDFLLKNPHLALQGEIIGAGVQGNKFGYNTVDYRVFNVFDRNKKRYLTFEEIINNFIGQSECEFVPIIESGDNFIYDLDQLEEISKTLKYDKTNYPAEGIVVRAKDQSISFKYINPLFLLKNA